MGAVIRRRGGSWRHGRLHVMDIAQEFGVPCLCNIHDVQLAMEFCNKIIGLQDGVKMFDGPVAQMDQSKLDEIYAMEVL